MTGGSKLTTGNTQIKQDHLETDFKKIKKTTENREHYSHYTLRKTMLLPLV